MGNQNSPLDTESVSTLLWTVERGRDLVRCRLIVHACADGTRLFEVRTTYNGSLLCSLVHSEPEYAEREQYELLSDYCERGWSVVAPDSDQVSH